MSAVRPFLKWAGGKRQLLPRLRAHYPESFGAYIEPFVGSGAVFFDLHNRGALAEHEARLADSSTDLIDCYLAVRDHVEELITNLQALEAGHQARGERHYYEVRDERFNPLRRQVSAERASTLHAAPGTSHVNLAAMLIYLNRTGYNGLFRLNSSGDFNVPIGRYARPRICDAANLRAASRALRAHGVSLTVASFLESLAVARPGDFVYLDPPYAPLTRTASFTAYTASRFDTACQHALRQAVVDLAARGGLVLLSNSVADEVRLLYEDDAVRRAGLRTYFVPARRAINSRSIRRGPVNEYVITNVGC